MYITFCICVYDSSYLIVEFPQESGEDGSNPTAIVSSSWTFEDSTDNKLCCWWPNFKSDEQRKKAVIQHKEIDVENCVPCEIIIKYKTGKLTIWRNKKK